MSRPSSRLANYRSYSYYHVLAVCDTSATADALSQSTDLGVWLHPETGTGELGKYSPRSLKVEGTTGNYVILINGSTDADLVITTAQWAAATAGSVVAGDSNQSLVTEGSLIVSEPRGVIFLDRIVMACLSLGRDASDVVYCLKTFFVGYAFDDERGDYVEHLNNVSPIQFIAYDVTAQYTESGGDYTMQFVALANGGARLPQYSRAADGFTLNLSQTDGSATLDGAIKKLEAKIKQNYDQHFQCVKSTVYQKAKDTFGDEAKARSFVERLTKVEYVIDVDPAYKNAEYVVSDAPVQTKNIGKCEEGVTIKNPPGTSIESAIHGIMGMCDRVQQDMGKGDLHRNNIKYEYRINTAIESIPNTDGTSTTRVVYFVKKFAVAKSLTVERLLQLGANNTGPVESQMLKDNTIEFDYIYTGQNIDILEFDMKVNLGLHYLQIATLSNSYRDQLELLSSRTTHVPGLTQRFEQPTRIPVMFGSQIRLPRYNNTQTPDLTAGAAYTMSKHASLEVAEATVKVVGNHKLLNSINAATTPRIVTQLPAPTQQGDATREADFAHWSQFPAFAVVNVAMPGTNDDLAFFEEMNDPSSSDQARAASYTRPFWYTGHYYVYAVENAFREGELTHTLHMIAMPKSDTFESLRTSDSTQTNLDFSKMVSDCYDSRVKCGQSAATSTNKKVEPSQRVSPEEKKDVTANREAAPPANANLPATRQDAETLNQSGSNPADVKMWSVPENGKLASDAVKKAIVNASYQYGVDPKTMAQMAYIESRFNPGAKAPTSSASGIYQHIDGTWQGLVQRGKVKSVEATTPRSASLPKRFDPTASAEGGAALLIENQRAIGSTDPGDLYLAHFAGAGTAKKVIAACRAGNGSASLEPVLGTKTYQAMRNANPFMVKKGITTCEGLRNWASMAMAKTLVAGVPVAQPTNIVPSTSDRVSATRVSYPVPPPQRLNTAAESAAASMDCEGQRIAAQEDNKSPCGSKPINQFTEIPTVSKPVSKDGVFNHSVVKTTGVDQPIQDFSVGP